MGPLALFLFGTTAEIKRIHGWLTKNFDNHVDFRRLCYRHGRDNTGFISISHTTKTPLSWVQAG